MPSRVIRGEINSSRSLSRVSLGADLLFRALLVAVDDFGRMDARAPILKAALFPARDEVGLKEIESWLAELAREGCVQVYQVGEDRFLCLPNWERHRGKQRRAKESRIPGPEAGSPVSSADPLGDPRKSEESSPGVGVGVGGGGGGEEDRSSEKIETLVVDRTDAALAARPPADPTPLLNLLSREPGAPDEKAAWLEREYPLLCEMAARDYPGDHERQRREINSRVIRHWRQHRKNPPGPNGERESPTQARIRRGKEAAARVAAELNASGGKL